ncbi:hypothetical protein [Streptomyces blattellae]|uniref:hypothetical protein n=1 Tax=Streptomyces blattellae TaxID=2569855 RepID=UPI0012B7ABED|nr:hypothetical protein [Streptomyces blattellae]
MGWAEPARCTRRWSSRSQKGPFPDEGRLLLLNLSTTDVEDLYFYQAVLATEGVRNVHDEVEYRSEQVHRKVDEIRDTADRVTSAINPFG